MAGENLTSKKEKKHEITIQLSMLISFLLVLMIACGSIIYYNYIRTTQAFLSHVDDDIKKATESIVRSTVEYLVPAKSMTQISGGVVETQSNILEDPNKIVPISIQMLKVFPQISGFYHGDHIGNFLSITRVSPGSFFPFDTRRQLPDSCAYDIHIISRLAESITSEYHEFKDKHGLTIAVDQRPVSAEYYDPRVRPWFVAAVSTKKPVWSDPYVFASTRQVGITAAYPVLNKLGNVSIVLSADITMLEISNLLGKHKVGKSGIAFIFNDQGQVIGYPDITQIMKKSIQGQAALPTVEDTKNSAVIAAYKTFKNTRKKEFIQTDQKIEYIVRFIEITEEIGQLGYIGFVARKSEFTAEADRMTNTMAVFSIVIFVLSAGMIYLVSRNISRPIQQTAKELEKIGNFEIDSQTPTRSHYYEISLMNQALDSMKRSLRDFSRFVPKAVVRKLIESGEGAELGGKKMNITVMFSDIENFTGISEKMSSEKLTLHISDYFDQLTQIILEEQGTVDKYIGDSIMAFWGAPMEDKEHPFHACRAVLSCSKRLHELNKNWALEGKPPLLTRFGVHTGDAVVGNVGSKDRLNYSAFGDSVNLASRIEGVNKVYHSYLTISHDTYKEVRDNFICRPLDIVAVIGKTEGVGIYELMAERSTEPRDKYEQERANKIASLTFTAFEQYVGQEFKKAEKSYQDLLHLLPDDYVAQLYIHRCQDYQKNPPPKNWRGIYFLKQK
jgi:adenylate cyclase